MMLGMVSIHALSGRNIAAGLSSTGWLRMTVNLQERFYFGDTVLPLFESGIPLVRQRMQSLPDADNITIAYPDEGAWKRFHYQFGDYPEVRPG